MNMRTIAKVVWVNKEIHDRLRTQAYLKEVSIQTLVGMFLESGLEGLEEEAAGKGKAGKKK